MGEETIIKFVVVDEYMSAREETLVISESHAYTGTTYADYVLWVDNLQNLVINGTIEADWYGRKDLYIFCLGEQDEET